MSSRAANRPSVRWLVDFVRDCVQAPLRITGCGSNGSNAATVVEMIIIDEDDFVIRIEFDFAIRYSFSQYA